MLWFKGIFGILNFTRKTKADVSKFGLSLWNDFDAPKINRVWKREKSNIISINILKIYVIG